MNLQEVKRLTDLRKSSFVRKSGGSFTCTIQPNEQRNKGYYGVLFAKPVKRLAASLGVTREILVLVTTFTEQQARTMEAIEHHIRTSVGRLEIHTAIVLHEDPDGNSKLRKWGVERGIVILPIVGTDLEKDDFKVDSYLATELFAQDPFDVTGPVSDDTNFFGRRDEALDLARKLQQGAIRSCLGIRKVGKTSILNRVVSNLRDHHECHTVFVDCSKDTIWSCTPAELGSWLGIVTQKVLTGSVPYCSLDVESRPSASPEMANAMSSLQSAVAAATKPIVLIFDEVDYITPGSPTAPEIWSTGFNIFWRNLRAAFQEATRTGRKLSVMVAGVSSKWFFAEKVNGVENAALAFIPEEYLSRLSRGATEAMIKTLAKRAGLQFDATSLSEVSAATGDMPYWSRKLCSYIHRNVSLEGRPRKCDSDVIRHLIEKFISEEGGSIARVAISHLFSVYPELRVGAELCFGQKGAHCSDRAAYALARYGIIREDRILAGKMMEQGVKLTLAAVESEEASPAVGTAAKDSGPSLGEWAEELAAVGKRRNVLERKLRVLVGGLVRFDSLTTKEKMPARDRVLRAVQEKRRKTLEYLPLDDMMEKLLWSELIVLMGREWALFERIFGAKDRFVQAAEVINDRPDAHAKQYDQADLALYRRSLKQIEDAVKAVD